MKTMRRLQINAKNQREEEQPSTEFFPQVYIQGGKSPQEKPHRNALI